MKKLSTFGVLLAVTVVMFVGSCSLYGDAEDVYVLGPPREDGTAGNPH